MFRPFTLVLERAAEILVPEESQPRIASIGERMTWMRGGAVLANMRTLPFTADIAAAGMPFGYWRGLHPSVRTDLELALLAGGQQFMAAEPRYDIVVMGLRHARTLQRAARRLIALATEKDEKVIEIVHIEIGRRCGMTVVRAGAQPLRLQPALRDFLNSRERSA